ncbi:hypothetical protein PTSG_11712 [Salpingoeca rosetta]|uniref:Uncharacterized protein n=1 Tax=Salpingoeca rosetta (strain ATCC 50818 / BSB-021) TaxID=946362 RepID=F2U037_SALR5|nr:uncharacterized protein PTSG_11712 [Salpingoeca rosetta]EGD80765.1 hypothetical protein PTSG_11712 [Salpingoeca rosetta]|eukprot:XP_004997326.1 hypothetical protein PTSG_11712 [Salpingoeca rosetta]
MPTGFLAALLEEVICHGTLRSTTSSLQSYWLPTLLDDAARTALEDIVAAASADDTSKTRGGGLWSSMWGSHKF